jgi:hypothetical protein
MDSLPITRDFFCRLETKWDESVAARPFIALAAIVTVAVLPILLLCDAARSAYLSYILGVPSRDYDYFYSTKIFSTYQEQLHQFIQSEVKKNPKLASLDLVQWIENGPKDPETHFKGVVARVRKLVRMKDRLALETAQFVERFCKWIYTGPKLLNAMSDWLKIQAPEEEIDLLYKKLGAQTRFQGQVFQDYLPYDPRALGDAPSLFFNIGTTQVIRTPAVTRDLERTMLGTLKKAEIVEEFEGFLESYEKEGKHHLYVNLMAHGGGSEQLRNEALIDLERKLKATLHLVHLSKDCSFYHQSHSFSGLENAAQFKQVFIDQMFGVNPAFKWPSVWDQKRTKEICQEAIDRVHQNHFESKETLSREERCDFIELVYTEIIEALILSTKPASCNVSCRSCVDRGAVNLSLLYAKTQPKSPLTLATIALTPAMLSQGRMMLPHRMHRLRTALARLS